MSKYKKVFAGLEYTIIAHSWSYSVVPEEEKKNITWKIIIDNKEKDLEQTGESIKYKFKKDEQGKMIMFKAFDKTKENHAVVLVYVSMCKIAPSWLDKEGNKIEETPYGREVCFELLFEDLTIEKSVRFTVMLENEDKSFSKQVFTTGNIGCKVVNRKAGIYFKIKDEWRDNGPKDSLYDLYLSVKAEGMYSFYDKKGLFFASDDICKERLLIKDFFVDEQGFVINPRVEKVEQKTIYSRSIEVFKDKTKVNAIVLHRTDDSKGSQTLATAKSQKQGGHFTIEGGVGTKTKDISGKDGAIYQFGSLRKSVSHVGKIRPRPTDPDPSKKKKWLGGDSYHSKEIQKKYPDRFPYNGDSIGIEVIGLCLTTAAELKKNGGWEAEWEPLTQEQIINTAWLTKGLLQYFELDKDADIYAHEIIRSKTWDEGGTVLRAIKPYL